jgi:hypothetical protein
MRFHRHVLPIVVMLAAGPAVAGDGVETRIVAATTDGAFYAYWEAINGTVGNCGLLSTALRGDKPVLAVSAACQGRTPEDVLPLGTWRWAQKVPQISQLRPFSTEAPWEIARITEDRDTRIFHLEIHQGSAWVVARVIEGKVPGVSGVLATPSGFVLRVSYSHSLRDWDEIWTVSQEELDRAPQRQEHARTEAHDVTLRMREHRSKGTGVFSPKPAGFTKEKWAQRRRHGLAKFLHQWEIAAAYGPLTSAELREALWLLGWFDSPPRRYQALRWYRGLLERDARGAAEVVEELTRDPDTQALADFLRKTRDPLWHLPGAEGPLSDETLRPLSDEQLHWVHRALWAARLGCRFTDPLVAAVFALQPSYTPVSERRWRRMLKEMGGDLDATFLRPPNPDIDMQTILREEHRRGLAAPRL